MRSQNRIEQTRLSQILLYFQIIHITSSAVHSRKPEAYSLDELFFFWWVTHSPTTQEKRQYVSQTIKFHIIRVTLIN